MVKFINSIILFSIFFPYFAVLSPEQHYTQPYPVILSLIGLCINIGVLFNYSKIKMPTGSITYLAYLAGSSFIFFSTVHFSSIPAYRDLFGYFSLLILSLTVYMIAAADFKLFTSVVKMSIILWAGVGFIQTYFNPAFLNILTGGRPIDHLINSGRGVTSLAPEPTHFGLIMGTFLLAGLFLNLPKLYCFVCIISILFFSKSSSAVLFLLMVVSTIFIIRKPFKVIPLVIGLVTICYFASESDFINSLDWRIIKLSKSFISDPNMTIMSDESLRVRLNSMWLPIYASFKNLFIPHGFDPNVWAFQVNNMEEQFGDIVANLDKERIGAALPMMFFQTGFFTLIPLLPLLTCGIKIRNTYSLLLVISFFSLGLQYISPAFTMLGFLLGLIFYDLTEQQKSIKSPSQPLSMHLRICKKLIESASGSAG
jgi:hypothetical protein